MKTFAIALAAGLAGTASADISDIVIDRAALPVFSNGNGITMTATPIGDDVVSTAGFDGTLYSNMEAGGGFQAFSPATGPLGFDDYTGVSAEADPQDRLDTVRFVGGVANAGEIIFFDFFDSAGLTFIDGFGVAFSQGGNFIWTITLGGDINVNNSGILQLTANDDALIGPVSTGQWFLSDAAPTIGTQDSTFGGAAGGALAHKFELNIPSPASAALLGLGGLAAARRRR